MIRLLCLCLMGLRLRSLGLCRFCVVVITIRSDRTRHNAHYIVDEIKRVHAECIATVLQITAHAIVRIWARGGSGSESVALRVHYMTLGAPWPDIQGAVSRHSS